MTYAELMRYPNELPNYQGMNYLGTVVIADAENPGDVEFVDVNRAMWVMAHEWAMKGKLAERSWCPAPFGQGEYAALIQYLEDTHKIEWRGSGPTTGRRFTRAGNRAMAYLRTLPTPPPSHHVCRKR